MQPFVFNDVVRVTDADQMLANKLNEVIKVTEEMQTQVAALPALTKPAVPIQYGDGDKIRVVTVRMPVELHAALLTEANRRNTSLNRLSIAKLSCLLPDDVAVPPPDKGQKPPRPARKTPAVVGARD